MNKKYQFFLICREEGNITLEEKYLIQMNTINTLKRDNVEMAAIIKKMEEDIYILKVISIFLKIFNLNRLKTKKLKEAIKKT